MGAAARGRPGGGREGRVLSRFRFVHDLDVRFRDLDAIGHVNNAVFLTYFEAARLASWLHTTRREGVSEGRSKPLPDDLRRRILEQDPEAGTS